MVATASDGEKRQRPPTQHEQNVYKACSLIPEGKVSTYGALATILKSAPRAIGQALKRNPFAPEVPCHRVVSSSLQIGGFNGTWGKTSQVACKKEMLLMEDVAFETEDTVSATSVIPCADLAKLYNLHALSCKQREDC
ncbi:hypothetical protein WJX77_011992 [Trebouxia sp. C0004]